MTNSQFWGIDSPIYGNHGAVDGRDGFIYLFGALGAGSPNYNERTNFLARVPFANPTDYWAYTYWDGQSWSNTPLSNPQTDGAAPASIIKGAPQGSVIWSNHYSQFMYLYPGPFFSNGKPHPDSLLPKPPISPSKPQKSAKLTKQ